MSSPDSNSSDSSQPDFTYSSAHGTVMVLAWMVFASTGILFARYGRLIRFGVRRQLLSEAIWFQAHRLALSLAALATLLGFFFILVQAAGTWVDAATDGARLFAHSILGVIIVCCATLQVWMALFRCHPNTRFRFIFNWAHRGTGLLSFILSIPTIFLIVVVLPHYHAGLVAILSIWTAWVVIIVIAFESINYKSRSASKLSSVPIGRREVEYELEASHSSPHADEIVKEEYVESERLNRMKLVLLVIHIIVSIALATPLIVLIWLQV